jgi:hypothetical protein
MVGKAFQHDFY